MRGAGGTHHKFIAKPASASIIRGLNPWKIRA